MRLCLAGLLVLVSTPAAADTFGGFGGREDGYLVGKDRICTPLIVENAAASGSPSCKKSTDDEIAQMSIKSPKAVRGADASHSATAKTRTLTVMKGETVVVTWKSADPISKVNDLIVSQYGNLIAVEYTVRRGGRDITDVVAFQVGRFADDGSGKVDTTTTTTPDTTEVRADTPPEPTPAMKKALKAARKAAKGNAKKAIKAWQKVLALDDASSEALLGLAIAQARAKKMDDAYTTLETLAASTRTDAVEYLVKARFDKAFKKVLGNERFRAATGLDKPYGTFYERLMGHGGVWQQDMVACQEFGALLTLNQDRTLKLKISGNCSGDKFSMTFKGRWEPSEPTITITIPTKGFADEPIQCTVEREGDEDAIKCPQQHQIDPFVVRPVRR